MHYMEEPMAKGELFQNVLAIVVVKWGKDSLDNLKHSASQYESSEWYSIGDFCIMLTEIKKNLGNGDSQTIYDIAYEMISSNFRWRTVFPGRDPVFVFLSTKRQDTQYRGGQFMAARVGDNHIQVTMSGWSDDPIWYEFYRGRMQSVLDLTGHKGKVELTALENIEPAKYTYNIFWEN